MGTVRQKVATLIDYRGDCAKYDASTGPRMYSSDFSPNNIRRIVISPEGVMVVYHRAIRVSGSSRPYNFVRFNAVDLYKEEQSQNYKPLLSLLSSPLICSCLEEIVIWGSGENGIKFKRFCGAIHIPVKFFCDNNEDLWGKTKTGIPIISPEELAHMKNSVVLISFPSQQVVDRKSVV